MRMEDVMVAPPSAVCLGISVFEGFIVEFTLARPRYLRLPYFVL